MLWLKYTVTCLWNRYKCFTTNIIVYYCFSIKVEFKYCVFFFFFFFLLVVQERLLALKRSMSFMQDMDFTQQAAILGDEDLTADIPPPETIHIPMESPRKPRKQPAKDMKEVIRYSLNSVYISCHLYFFCERVQTNIFREDSGEVLDTGCIVNLVIQHLVCILILCNISAVSVTCMNQRETHAA